MSEDEDPGLTRLEEEQGIPSGLMQWHRGARRSELVPAILKEGLLPLSPVGWAGLELAISGGCGGQDGRRGGKWDAGKRWESRSDN